MPGPTARGRRELRAAAEGPGPARPRLQPRVRPAISSSVRRAGVARSTRGSRRRRARVARSPRARPRADDSEQNKRPPRGWPFRTSGYASMRLLYAGEEPAARAVGWLDEVPHLFEAPRRRARRLAHHAGEAHARPMLVVLGRHLEQVRIERDHIGLLRLGAARENVLTELVEHLARGELADPFQLPDIVGNLQLHEVKLRGAQETRSVEACGDCTTTSGNDACRLRRQRWRHGLRAKIGGVLHRLRRRTPVRKSTQPEHHAYSKECQQEHSAESAAAKEVAKQAAEREAAQDRHPTAARRLSGLWLCGLRWRRDRRRRDISLRAG